MPQAAEGSQLQASSDPPGRDEWRVPADPVQVPAVRKVVRGFAAAHGAPDEILGDLALAVTEAATNVILHAYVDRAPGSIQVTAQAAAGELVVCVIDDGRGMQPRPDSPGLGMGLPMIGQLTTSVDIRERATGGTEVRMRFAAPGVRGPTVSIPEGDVRLQLLVEVARLAQAGGWPQEGVGRLVHLLVPVVADGCALDRAHGDVVQRLAAAGEELALDVLPEAGDVMVEPGKGGLAWRVSVPLLDGDRVIGALRLGLTSERGRPDEQDLVFLETLGQRAARGLASSQLVADLHRTRRRVERILDTLAEAVTVHDDKGNMVYANAAAAELLGASSVEEVLASAPGELAARFVITREDGSPVGVEDLPGRHVLAGEDSRSLLTRSVLKATGQERWMLTKATLLDDGERLAVNIIEDVTEAKRAELRARFLAHAGEVLSASLDAEHILRELAALVVPELADWCAVDLVGADGAFLPRVAVAHTDPDKLAFARELERRYPAHEDPSEAALAVLAGGPPILVPHLTDEMLAGRARDAEQLRLLREVGMRSVLVLPMRVVDRTVGVLTMITAESARAFDEGDLAFGLDLARRAAAAVENARLFSERAPG